MQNPPILTVTGTRRPHDRAGRISPPHGIAIFGYICENRVVDCNTVTGENVWRLRRAEPANKRQTRGMPPARSRPACCRSGRVWCSVTVPELRAARHVPTQVRYIHK